MLTSAVSWFLPWDGCPGPGYQSSQNPFSSPCSYLELLSKLSLSFFCLPDLFLQLGVCGWQLLGLCGLLPELWLLLRPSGGLLGRLPFISASRAETRVICGLHSIIQFIDLIRVLCNMLRMLALEVGPNRRASFQYSCGERAREMALPKYLAPSSA